jgi:hypothetical protein
VITNVYGTVLFQMLQFSRFSSDFDEFHNKKIQKSHLWLVVIVSAVWTHSPARATGSEVPRAAIVRGVPDSFTNALSMTKPSTPIDLELAKQQHAAYVNVLKGKL